MRLGIALTLPHQSPEEWAKKHRAWGCSAVKFPLDHRAEPARIDAYVAACRACDLQIAEVGAWCNPLEPGEAGREKIRFCQDQLRLADYVGARCCVNIAGACGEKWDGGYAENYTADTCRRIRDTVREIIDAVRPSRTFYTLEPMPWMLPDGPDAYAKLLAEVDRERFAVHMDIVNLINRPERYFFNRDFMEECFAKLGDRIKSCHLKDVRLEPFLTFNLKEVACGEGALDMERYGVLAEALDPEMPVLIEHLPDQAAYAASLELVRGRFAAAGINLR